MSTIIEIALKRADSVRQQLAIMELESWNKEYEEYLESKYTPEQITARFQRLKRDYYGIGEDE